MQVEAFVVQQLGQLQGNDAQTGPDSPEEHAANHKAHPRSQRYTCHRPIAGYRKTGPHRVRGLGRDAR